MLVGLPVRQARGNRVFLHTDIEALFDKSAAPLLRLAREATKLNKMSETDLDAAEGEFEAIPAGSLSTVSPNGSE